MRYSFFLIFILAHLTGDFALQTDKIAELKSTSVKGVAIHAGIIAVVQMLFLSVFGLQGVLLGAACGIIHFLIDFVKGRIGKILNSQFLYFLFDQVIHFSIIALFTLFFTPSFMLFSIDILYVKIPIIIIVLVFVSNITAKILIKDLDIDTVKDAFFKKRERVSEAVVCSAAFLSLLLPFPASIFPVVLGFYPYARLMKSKFGYSNKTSAIKYAVYILISFAMLLFFTYQY